MAGTIKQSIQVALPGITDDAANKLAAVLYSVLQSTLSAPGGGPLVPPPVG